MSQYEMIDPVKDALFVRLVLREAYRLNLSSKPIPTPGEGVRQIIREVAREHRVTPADIMGPRRLRHIAEARFEVYHRLRHELGLTLPRIGQIMGRDHTSVLNGLRKYAGAA